MALLPEYSANVLGVVNNFYLAANELGIDIVLSLEANITQDTNQDTIINKGKRARYPRAWLRMSLTSDISGFAEGQTPIERFSLMLVVAVSNVDSDTKKQIRTFSELEGYAKTSALGKNLLAKFRAICVLQGNKIKMLPNNIGGVQQRMHTIDSSTYRGDFRFAVEACLDNPCETIQEPFIPKPPFDSLGSVKKPITDRDIIKYE